MIEQKTPECFGKPGKIGQTGCNTMLCPYIDECMKAICPKCAHQESNGYCFENANRLCFPDKPVMFTISEQALLELRRRNNVSK